ncbi:MAG: OB-fold nucleic acid binding domain-containing protein [Rhizomicrobium sp.]
MIRKSERRGRNDQTYAFVSFSDPTGMFEVMLFPEVLQAARPLLEAGKSVLVTASADWDGDDLKLRAASIADLDAASAQAGEGMRIYVDNEAALGPIASQLKQPGKGIVTLVVPGHAGEEVEIALPKRQVVTAALRNAIKMMPGVMTVEAV